MKCAWSGGGGVGYWYMQAYGKMWTGNKKEWRPKGEENENVQEKYLIY